MNHDIRKGILVTLVMLVGLGSTWVCTCKTADKTGAENAGSLPLEWTTLAKGSVGLINATGPNGSNRQKLLLAGISASTRLIKETGMMTGVTQSLLFGSSSTESIVKGVSNENIDNKKFWGQQGESGSTYSILCSSVDVAYVFNPTQKVTGNAKYGYGSSSKSKQSNLKGTTELGLIAGATVNLSIMDLKNKAVVLDVENNNHINSYCPGIYITKVGVGPLLGITSLRGSANIDLSVTFAALLNVWVKEGSTIIYSYSSSEATVAKNPSMKIDQFATKLSYEVNIAGRYNLDDNLFVGLSLSCRYDALVAAGNSSNAGAADDAKKRAPSLMLGEVGITVGYVIT